MATGGDDQPRSGYEGRDWSTEPGSRSTQRQCETEWMAVDDEVYFRIRRDLRDAASVEDAAESRPPEAGCVDDDVREEELVTQLAVHSAFVSDIVEISSSSETHLLTRPPATRAWQAGDASQQSVCTPYDNEVVQQPVTLGRHVTTLVKQWRREKDVLEKTAKTFQIGLVEKSISLYCQKFADIHKFTTCGIFFGLVAGGMHA